MSDAIPAEFKAQAFFISGFEESRSQLTMNINR